ncbi:DUF2461 domain-containing protein [Massilia sp. W12]|uniref:DUF2461 domain-containing protein n=1 Tax=Massilia sp. W12 TaxID=3126507 RepID=UPI0030CA6F55
MHVRDLMDFLAQLAQNNNRAWFVMNKPRYDILRAEFLQVVTDLVAQVSRFDPALAACDPKKAIFRINRDVRFSADKSPYKTTFSAALSASDRKKPSEGGGPVYYFHIDQDGQLLFACGEYMPPPPRVQKVRQAIVADAENFGKMLKNRAQRAEFGDLQREHELQRLPKGFAADSPHPDYLRLKDFMIWKQGPVPAEIVNGAQLVEFLAARFAKGLPLMQWLRSVPLA